jgi:ribonuclease-3
MAVRDTLRPAIPRRQLKDPVVESASSGGHLARAIGYVFTRPEIATEALTHPSALAPQHGRSRRGRHPSRRSYERLEFLGDRVLGLVIADLLWRRFESEPEGHLTRRLTHLVRGKTLTRVAEGIGLGAHLLLSPAEKAAGAATNPGILADMCEALIAAIYLDGGFEAASDFIRRFWQPLVDEMEEPPRDPKTTLQEWAQARALPLPIYELVGTSGPDHAPRFTVAAKLAGRDSVTATASSKRVAEAKAAELLLERLAAET